MKPRLNVGAWGGVKRAVQPTGEDLQLGRRVLTRAGGGWHRGSGNVRQGLVGYGIPMSRALRIALLGLILVSVAVAGGAGVAVA
jgi:hypothetical protein